MGGSPERCIKVEGQGSNLGTKQFHCLYSIVLLLLRRNMAKATVRLLAINRSFAAHALSKSFTWLSLKCINFSKLGFEHTLFSTVLTDFEI